MTAEAYYTCFDSPLGEIILAGNKDGLTDLHINIRESSREFVISDLWSRNDAFFEGEIRQLNEYFDGQRTEFKLKLNPQGTDFQKKVWDELCKIPFGETRSYKGVAENIGNTKSCRAVGMANSKNPIPLIIPCHRVVGADGKLSGFAYGADIKRRLIELEKMAVKI